MENENIRYAGFWMRAAALLLDQMFITIFFFILGAVGAIVFIFSPDGTTDGLNKFVEEMEAIDENGYDPDRPMTPTEKLYMYLQFSYIPLSILYHAICEATSMNGSIAKRIIGLAVLRKQDGSPVGFMRALMRNLMAWVIGIFTLTIGHWFAGWTKQKRALHDMVAGTVIVRRDSMY